MTATKRKTLAELKASQYVGLPETSFDLCVAGKLNLERERIQIALRAELDAEKSPRVGSKSATKKLNDEHEKLIEQMSEFLVTLKLRAKHPKVWRDWRAANPARENDDLDEQVGYDVDALTDSLRDFVISVNDEPVTDEWWDLITEAAAPGDWWRLTERVIGLQTGSVEVPKSLTGYLKSRESEDDSK